MTGRASTSSSFNYQWTYDVFINFRGEDTRHGFTGNLYHALKQKGVRTFIDDEDLEKGNEITPTLLKAIEESRMAITIFSKNYASSTFCLNELDKILQCIKRKSRLVWPIFYDVEPSDVRYQKGNYEEALAMHEKHLKASKYDIQRWKNALREVANISGSYFSSRNRQYEYQFIESTVNEISSKINRVPFHVAEYPVGIDFRVQQINSLLQIWSNDEVGMVGMCGIGGIGKTTIARAVYNSIADNFEGLCFLHDIKEKSRKFGLEQMQERMLSKILGVEIKIDDVNEGIPIIKRRLNQKKILLILDDVDKREQLENLANECTWFGPGSRIIITTRDRHLLLRHGVRRIYDMEAFNYDESLELLTWNAFRDRQVDPSYIEVLNRVIRYVQGLPLALEIIGAHLFGMNITEWESALDVYRRIPHKDIQQILKVSYDGLQEVEQEIFLDIACFFQGKGFDYVVDMMELAHGFDPRHGIKVLEAKSLVRIYQSECIEMHDLIQDMGREIVRQESLKDPGQRSRLWLNEDIVHVLEEKTGSNKVRIIIQDHSAEYIEVDWDGKAFKNMKSLKILIFEKARFSEGPKYLPNSLKVIKWRGYPSSYLPLDFCPKKLVVFSLPDSSLNSLEQIMKLKNLSVLNLGGCQHIKQIPNLSYIPNLKELRLESCKNLIEIHESVGALAKLETLNAEECVRLETFPHSIKLPFLNELCLKGCSSLKYFPEILEKMECIEHLELTGTGIEKVPFSFCNLTGLRKLTIEQHREEIELPSSIVMLPDLQVINAEKCGKLLSSKPNEGQGAVRHMLCSDVHTINLRQCNIPDELLSMYLSWFTSLLTLDLTGSNFTILPACMKECHSLEAIVLNECKHLREVKGIPRSMKRLEAGNCLSLSSESRNLLLSQNLFPRDSPRRLHLFMPGASIPKWFDHCSRGPFISFWFRHYFPSLAVCVVIPAMDVDYNYQHAHMIATFFINGKKQGTRTLQKMYAQNDYHIIVYDIKSDDLMTRTYPGSEWNHVEICTGADYRNIPVTKQSGIYVIRKDFTEDNFRFTDPHERLDDNLMLDFWSQDKGYIYQKYFNYLQKRESEDRLSDDDDSNELNSDYISSVGCKINYDLEELSLHPYWETPLDDHDENDDSLSMLSSSRHASDTVCNPAGWKANDGYEWLSLHPSWETPLSLDDHDVTLALLPLPLLTWPNHSMNAVNPGDSTEADGEPRVANKKKEPMLYKKRKSQEKETSASRSTAIPFRRTKRGGNRLVNEHENNANTTLTQYSSNVSDDPATNQDSLAFDAQEKDVTSSSADSKWTSLSLWASREGINKASRSGYTTNAPTSSNQGNNVNNGCEWLSLRPIWESPLHGSTTHQEFQPRQNATSINLEEIPESSSEAIRKAKGKEIIVYNDNINEK